jgi:hypothetical protein
MGPVIKIINRHCSGDDDISRLLKYTVGKGRNENKEKVLFCNGKGVSKDPDKAVKQMIQVQKYYNKDKRRRMYHMVVSFPEYIRSEYVIKRWAESIAEMLFERYQVYYGIHTSTYNWHIHFAFNAVSYIDGKKWHQSKKDMWELKKSIREICNTNWH